MGFIWNKILVPALKVVANFLIKCVTWSFGNPVSGLATGLGLLLLVPFLENTPWLQGVVGFMGATFISAAISGAIVQAAKDAAAAATSVVVSPEPAARAIQRSFWASEDIATELGF